jgi:kynureninase
MHTPSAYAVCQALIAAGIVADFRSPDLLRFGFSPLILSFEDIRHSVHSLASIVVEKRYLEQGFNQRLRVT